MNCSIQEALFLMSTSEPHTNKRDICNIATYLSVMLIKYRYRKEPIQDCHKLY